MVVVEMVLDLVGQGVVMVPEWALDPSASASDPTMVTLLVPALPLALVLAVLLVSALLLDPVTVLEFVSAILLVLVLLLDLVTVLEFVLELDPADLGVVTVLEFVSAILLVLVLVLA